MSYQPKNYREQGGDKQVVASGGEIEMRSGSTLDLQSGTILSFPGDAGKGIIPLSIFTTRLLTTNAFLNTIEAGTPDGNTAPSLARINGATDKMARLAWAASASDEIQFANIVYPPDLDDASAVTVHFLAAMAGATDTPVLTVSYWEGVGDTNAGGDTGAVTGTAIAEYSVSIAAGDIGAAPKVAAIGLTPGAHTTDALYVYAAWVEYTRKTTLS